MGVKTVDEARALPEVSPGWWIEAGALLAGAPINGDEIVLFVDADGRAMQVVETQAGTRKAEFR